MKIISGDISKLPPLPAHTVLCLGYFDGVHLGHQAIVGAALHSGNKVAVLTFDHSPKYILGLNQNEEVISSIEDRAVIFDNLGVSLLLVAKFDPPFAALTNVQFIQELNRLNPVSVYCGPDYRFGQLAKGDPNLLKDSPDAR
ncbi:MAG: adenylyltransferase/cytidyltransferase family protein, partial [Firmicutes bacterium]|nr:adenylyltransferase/cytidyltransferase family protein [Bacillota bacterium]